MIEIADLLPLVDDPAVAERISRLTHRQRALLDALVRWQAGRQAAENRIEPRPAGASGIPLSYAQSRLWFVDQLQPGSPAYNCPIAVRLRGDLDVAALLRSLRAIVDRHEALRTRFGSRDGTPFQIVEPHIELDFDLVDLSGKAEEIRERELIGYVLEDGGKPFDLATGPVIRTSLIRMDPRHHVLLMNIHHIATDGWSMRLFYEELAELYAAHKQGRPSTLPPLPVQYPDCSIWEQKFLAGDGIRGELDYWRRQLGGLPELDLPTDRPHPPLATPTGSVTYFRMGEPEVAAVTQFGREQRATLYMTMLAAFMALLGRYSGQTDFAVSTSVAGRPRPEVESLIGFFVNTLVMRADLTGDPTFRQLVDRVRETTVAAFANANVPFERLVDELQPVRDPGRIPLAPVIFLVDSTPDEGPKLDGLVVEPVEHDAGTAKFDLLLAIRVTEGRLRGRVQYRGDLFDHDTVVRFLDHYQVLLNAAVAAPDQPISALPVLTEAEHVQLVLTPNQTAVDFPDTLGLHQLFEQRATAQPDAVAARFGDTEITYRELDTAANHLAHHLIGHGVRRGDRVGLVLRRTPELLTAILGVLKAGASYVPLDPNYPQERLTFMLSDADLRAVVTERAVAESVPPTEVPVVDLVADADLLRAESDARPELPVDSAEDIAYVIYTSGSTGTPKGIRLAHRGVVNNLTDLNRRFDIGPGDSALALSSPSFDMCVYETLGMLTSGGTVVLPDPEAAKDPAHWAGLLVRHGVTVWNSAPSLLELLVEHLDNVPTQLPSLRVAWLGGDWIPVTLPDRIRTHATNLNVISLGGATEASIHSIIHPVTSVDPEWTSIPYGVPMANQEAYILDEAMQPVPVGVPGELYLAGVGLAKGYLNRPELTAEKFPRWNGKRVFRTGDLAKWRRDGEIELLGRKDFLVKVNGLRIELGEIEAALREHPQVADAVVAVRDNAGDKGLVGFVVAGPGGALDLADVRRGLEQRLPGYMIPPVLAVLDEIPVSPNGKIDRLALPEIRRDGIADGTGGPPTTDSERHVVSVWQELLGVDSIGVDEDFFDLGGDSFKAIRVVQQIRPGLPVVELFKNPTARRLGAFLDSTEAEATGGPRRMLHLLSPRPSARPGVSLVCVPFGGGNVVSYQPLANSLPERFALWSTALSGHELSRPDEPLLPIAESAQLLAEEIVERIDGPIALYGQCAGTTLVLETAALLEERGVELEAVYLGALLPDPTPEASVQRGIDDGGPTEEFYQALRSLGGFDGALSEADLAAILEIVWHDLLEASRFFLDRESRPLARLRAPVRVIVGDEDQATAGFEERFTEWERFAYSVRLAVLPGGGHYFVTYNAPELAEVLAAFHRA
jgi:amino acid adenylation domain-containing protein